MNLKPFLAPVCVLLLVATPGTARSQGEETDRIITVDTMWTDESVDVSGSLIIKEGATLTLQGAHLQVGQRIYVEEGATLHVTDSPGRESRVQALAPDEGYWMLIEGALKTSGTKTSEISGLTGTGLQAARHGTGGIQVVGTADLDNIHIHGDAPGLIIAEGATADIRVSTIQTSDYGIISMGALTIEDTRLTDNLVGILGFQTCDITIKDTTIAGGPGTSENVVLNSCSATLSDSVLEGARVSTVANNEAELTLRNSTVSGYLIDGLGSYASPDTQSQRMLRPSVRFHDVEFNPAPGAKRGADLSGNDIAEFINVTMAGHSEHGIQAQSASLLVDGSAITSNGGYGIHLTGGRFTMDPLQAGNEFGTMTEEENTLGAIRHVMITRFVTVDKDGQPLPGEISVTVHQEDGRPAPLLSPAEGDGSATASFEAYVANQDGQIAALGPFTYEATREDGRTWNGRIDPAQDVVLLIVKPPLMEVLADFAAPLAAVGIGALLTTRRLLARRFSDTMGDEASPPSEEDP